MRRRKTLLSDNSGWRRLKRAFDDLPIGCHLYVTDRCNLDCHYCTEYDNSVPHPPVDDVKRWIEKVRDLGCIRIGLQGGEPLLHPDIVEITRFAAKEMGLATSMSTNGFFLNSDVVGALEDAGLRSVQVSVDRMTPTASTRKSLKTIMPKLRHLEASGMRWHLSGVLFAESVVEAEKVLEYGLSNEVSTHTRLVHAGVEGDFTVDTGEREALDRVIDYHVSQKRRGRPIHTTSALLRYQKDMLAGRATDWECIAGSKFFFVSATGKIWLCSMQRTPNTDVMDVTPEMLRSLRAPRKCQPGCGVYCNVGESLFNSHPGKFLLEEARDRLLGRLARPLRRNRRRASESQTGKAEPRDGGEQSAEPAATAVEK